MINNKAVSFRIKPYAQEATLQIVVDVVVMVLLFLVLMIAKSHVLLCPCVVFIYFIVALTLHYKTIIQAIIDQRKADYITETVSIKQFTDEFSFAGNRLGHSNVRLFYPKDMQVQRYKIKLTNNLGEEKVLRSVMSFRRLLNFAVLNRQQIEILQVTYLRKSRILIWVDLVEEADKKKNKKRKKVIDKAVRFINNSI